MYLGPLTLSANKISRAYLSNRLTDFDEFGQPYESANKITTFQKFNIADRHHLENPIKFLFFEESKVAAVCLVNQKNTISQKCLTKSKLMNF